MKRPRQGQPGGGVVSCSGITWPIRRRIADGEWPPGHQLPSTRQLAKMYGVRSQSTVRTAITLLIETGELRGHQGLGVYVQEPGS